MVMQSSGNSGFVWARMAHTLSGSTALSRLLLPPQALGFKTPNARGLWSFMALHNTFRSTYSRVGFLATARAAISGAAGASDEGGCAVIKMEYGRACVNPHRKFARLSRGVVTSNMFQPGVNLQLQVMLDYSGFNQSR